MLDYNIANALATSGFFLIGWVALFLLAGVLQLALGWINDWEKQFKNIVWKYSEKMFFTPTSKLKTYNSRTGLQDRHVKSVTGEECTTDRELTVQQREELFSKYPELFRTTRVDEGAVVVQVAATLASLPIIAFLFINYTWIASSVAGFIAMAYTARLSVRGVKRLKKHIADPTAHKTTESE